MLLRTLLTTALLAVALTAALVVDCTTPSVELFESELAGVCSTVGFLGAQGGQWTGVGLWAFALLGLFATWAPVVRERVRRRRHEPAKAFVENLGRLAEVGSQLSEAEEEPDLAAMHLVARLVRRVEAVESAIISERIPSREATQQWVGLLKEANDLHNDGLLETDDFRKINTRLLDLFTVSRKNTGEVSESSSQ